MHRCRCVVRVSRPFRFTSSYASGASKDGRADPACGIPSILGRLFRADNYPNWRCTFLSA
jgi:hypothetical protein